MEFDVGNFNVNLLMADREEDHLKLVMQQIEAKIGDSGNAWDVLPTMFWIAEPSEMGLIVGEMPLPEPVTQDMSRCFQDFVDFCAVSEEARQYMKDQLLPKSGFRGLILFAEGWHVPTPGPEATEEQRSLWIQAQRDHEFYKHPDRREMRNGMGMTTNGRSIYMQRVRGGFPEFFEAGDKVVADQSRSDDAKAVIDERGKFKGIVGRLPTALHQFMWVCDSLVPESPMDGKVFK